MKNVLIIAHFWPYRGGSGRVLGLAKYLSEFGWQPIIITAPLDQKPEHPYRFVETPCPSILDSVRRFSVSDPIKSKGRQQKQRLGTISKVSQVRPLLACFYNIFMAIVAYPDIFKAWKPFAMKACNEVIQNEDIDAMISIWPVTSHIIAKELENKYKIPWVADFPDLWSQNYYYPYGPLRKWFDRKLELRTISNSGALLTVSEPMAEELKLLHKKQPVYAITHGFDPEEINTPSAKLTDKFTITYMGTIYIGKQDPSKLLAALNELICDGSMDPNEVEVRFYGREVDWLGIEIKRFGLSSIVKLYGMVARQSALQKERESQLLLVMKWEDSRMRGVYTLKIFDYLAARRPILATGGHNDVITELLEETGAGMDLQTTEDVKKALKGLYQEYKLNGKVAYHGDESKLDKYSHREMARKFSEVLDSLIKAS